MGTNSIIAVREDGEVRGRYVHWDGYPSYMGVELVKLVERDGLERVIEVLTGEHYGWSSISSEETGPMPDFYTADRFELVPHYGVAYTHEEQSDEWLGPFDSENSWAEYAYVLTPMGLEVYEQTVDGWKPRGVFDWKLSSVDRLEELK